MMVPKFRAWDNARDEYFQVRSLSFSTSIIDKNLGIVATAGNQSSYGPNMILEQYIGLKDKNSKEIYAGDILAWHSTLYKKHDWTGLVVYRGAGFVVQESGKAYSTSAWLECACREGSNIVEIIGNVHENPELLGEQHER